jgi:hypothetical protein
VFEFPSMEVIRSVGIHRSTRASRSSGKVRVSWTCGLCRACSSNTGSQGPAQTRSKLCRHAAHAPHGRETVPLLWKSFGGKDCDCTRMAWMDHAGERGHL